MAGVLSNTGLNWANLVNASDFVSSASSGISNDVAFNSLGMNSSVFGGLNGGFGGIGGFGSSKEQELYNSMTSGDYALHQAAEQEKLENFLSEKQTRQVKKANAEKFKETAADYAVKKEMGILQTMIEKNQQDKIKPQYDKYLDTVREKLRKEGLLEDKVNPDGSIDEKASAQEIEAEAERLYATETGERLVDDIEKHGDNKIVHGFIQGTGIGALIGNQKDAQDNIADITHQTVNVGDTVSQVIGGIAGAGLMVLGIFAAVRHGGNLTHAIGSGLTKIRLNSAEKALGKAKDIVSETGSETATEAYKTAKSEFKRIKAKAAVKEAQWQAKHVAKLVNRASNGSIPKVNYPK